MPDPMPYRLFNVTVAATRALSPSLLRVTFTGADVTTMKTAAPDQRIKIFFPDADGRPSALPSSDHWYQTYRAVVPSLRPPMRTYTIRHLRADKAELDVDFVLHGATGPASRWAMQAQAGDPVQIAAPNGAFAGDPGGYEWKPPAEVEHVLLIADETALPAVAGILEGLSARAVPPRVQAFLEVPSAADQMVLPAWPGLVVTWLPRDRAQPVHHEGWLMARAAAQAVLPSAVQTRSGPTGLSEIDIDHEVLWEAATAKAGRFYAWVAGESEAVLSIRRLLVNDRGLDRRSMNLMGYWRRGRALDDAA